MRFAITAPNSVLPRHLGGVMGLTNQTQPARGKDKGRDTSDDYYSL